MIACLLLPYFVADVVRKEHGIPKTVPVMVTRAKKVVATCQFAATYGIRPGMTQRQARWLCSEVQSFPVPTQPIRQLTEALLTLLCQFTHLVEIEPLTGYSKDPRQSLVMYVDWERLNEVETLGLTKALGTALKETGNPPAIGLTTTKFTAYATATQVACGQIRATQAGQEAGVLGPLSISLLPIEAEIERRLLLLGLPTLGACAALP